MGAGLVFIVYSISRRGARGILIAQRRIIVTRAMKASLINHRSHSPPTTACNQINMRIKNIFFPLYLASCSITGWVSKNYVVILTKSSGSS